MRPCRACPACTSPIFARCASPPGTACATLRALLCPARAPRGSTRGPRGAGGPSGPWWGTRTCSAGASWPRKERATPTRFIPVFTPPGKTYQQHALARGSSGVWLTSCRPSVRGWRSGPVPMRSVLYGRWASRRSPVGHNRLVPQGHGWYRSSRCLCSLRSSCAPLAEGLRHARSPITTAPHRPAVPGRRVASALIAGSEIELALLCAGG